MVKQNYLDIDKTKSGLYKLLKECLQIRDGDSLAILYDESFKPFFNPIKDIVANLKLQTGFLYLPIDYQEDLVKWSKDSRDEEVSIPPAIESVLADAPFILNVLSPNLKTSSLRRSVINSARARGSRLAHVPGLSESILHLLHSSPIDSIFEDCELYAWCLGEALEATIETSDSEGTLHSLSLSLGAWENEPIISPGVIMPGSWGNVPPGESFICPRPNASGSFVLNGSFPGQVLADAEEAVLSFDEGRLVGVKPAKGVVGRFIQAERDLARDRGDENWNVLAELGVGLNPAIEKLTGNQLFDEKALGTLHVAIGDNSVFGHRIRSDIHVDFVFKECSLLLDELCVIENGTLKQDVARDWRCKSHCMEELPRGSRVFIDQMKIYNNAKRLERRLYSAHRVGSIRMREDESAERALGQLAEWLKNHGHQGLPASKVSKYRPSIEGFRTKDLLQVLWHYRIIDVD